MNNSIWQHKIPTLFGILALSIGIIATSYLIKSATIFQQFAGASEDPKNVRISNITDSSFTVSYETNGQVVGSLIFGKDKNGKTTALDNRDTTGVSPHKLHYITVTALDPNTPYYFSIVSGQTTYSSGNAPFVATTGPTLSPAASGQIMKGSVVLPDGTSPNEAIVYAQSDSTQTLSSLVAKNGTYTIPISTIRTGDLTDFANSDNQLITLLAVGDSLSSNATVSKSTIDIPPITLSKDYDFTTSETPLATPSAFFGFSTLLATPSASTEPAIVSPKKDEQFTDQQPLFEGTGLPGSLVKITIQSASEITAQVTTDKNGSWSYRPNTPLSPGTHSITIETADKFGILRTLTQSFAVLASGTQVEQPATPSAIPTFVPTVIPTVQPTSTPPPTPTPLLLAPTSQPPVSGDSSAIKGGLGAFAISIVGLLLFLATRGRMSL